MQDLCRDDSGSDHNALLKNGGKKDIKPERHGSDAEPTTVGSPADLDFTLENLPAASQVDIMVSALNNGGESALSEKITITTH